MLQAGFEPAIPGSERPLTDASDCAAIGIGEYILAYQQLSSADGNINYFKTNERQS
jgi:hypothetical protein